MNWQEHVRQFYAEGFKKHHEDEIKASSQDLELWEFLESQGIEVQGDIIMELFLNVSDLGWIKESKNRMGIPEAVLDAYDFYSEHGDEQVRVAKVAIQERDTYAVRIKTDGDGGWLEVFDEQGNVIGTALTFLDVLSWEEQEVTREKFKIRGSVLYDWHRMRELSVCYTPRKD